MACPVRNSAGGPRMDAAGPLFPPWPSLSPFRHRSPPLFSLLPQKYGKYLLGNIRKDWESYYVDYKRLKDCIKECAKEFQDLTFSPRVTSLSVARPTGHLTAEDAFHRMLDEELDKITKFTQAKIAEIRAELERLAAEAERAASKAAQQPQQPSQVRRPWPSPFGPPLRPSARRSPPPLQPVAASPSPPLLPPTPAPPPSLSLPPSLRLVRKGGQSTPNTRG